MKLLVAGHITQIHGPVQALEKYLTNQKTSFVIVKHNLLGGNPLSYLTHFAKNIIAAYQTKGKIDTFIGIDNLNALSGVVLKKLGKVKKVIYYVIDYTPVRFQNPLLNTIYHLIERLAAKNADYIWNISNRIQAVHAKQGVAKEKNLVVPVGVFPERFAKVSKSKVNRNRVVILSHLTRDKGIQLAIEAMKELVKKQPQLELHIIGSGPYEKELKAKSKEQKSNIKFLGHMQPNEFIPYMSKCGVALAPYLDNPYSITYYCDPTKVKEYLAAGLPVITTNVPWIAKEVAKKPLGIVINYNQQELIAAVEKLTADDQFWQTCRQNAYNFMKDLTWEKIYQSASENSGIK
ncbi:MAG: glycosyltransferase [bacterium]